MPMDTVESLQREIADLRIAVDRAGCPEDERLFSDVRNNITTLLQNFYGDSSALYIACCAALPICFCLTLLLIYVSALAVSEKLMRARIARNLCESPVLQEHLQTRTLSQVSSRTARGRILFAITLKCTIATAVLVTFLCSRVMMAAVVRDWLRGLLTPPDSGDAEALKTYETVMEFLNTSWLKDLQSLFLFSTVGSGVMVLGLRLLRSATDDAMLLQTGANSSLQLLQKIDDQRKTQEQETMQKQMAELAALVAECLAAVPQIDELPCVEEDKEKLTLDAEKGPSDDDENDCAKKSNEDKEKTNTGALGDTKGEIQDKANTNENNVKNDKEEEVVTAKKLEQTDNKKGEQKEEEEEEEEEEEVM